MVKAKNKRNSGLSDKVNNKRKAVGVKKKLNPFEVHINKEKIKVLGKKSKHDRGLPGVSRAKAIQKRKETLGTEMKLMNKTNAFIDRRIGEKNSQLSSEDRMIARFAAERARQHSKKNIYNLADDEILTHRGQTLEQIEKFDDPRSSDEEEEDGKKFGGLDDDFVSEGHFGGGILSRTDAKDGAKSHKDLIEQLIAESKKRKAEKQKEKEQTLDLTEKLDSEWKDLQPVVFKRARVEEKESAIEKLLSQAEKKSEDYDKMMRELKFEKRGTPSDSLKSEEKQAKEEKERIEKLEKERELRMLGDEEMVLPRVQKTTSKHRSADDLDDNFELEDEQQFMLAYDNEGKPLVPEKILKDFSVPNAKPKFDDGISDTSSEEDEDDSDGDEENAEQTKDKVDNDDKSDDSEDDNDEESASEEESSKKQVISKTTKSKETVKQNDSKLELSVQEAKDRKKTDSNADKRPQNNLQKKENGILIGNDDDDDDGSGSDEEESSEGDDSDDENEDSEKENGIDNLDDLKESEGESDDELESLEEDQVKIRSFFDLKLKEGDNLKELLTGKTPSQQAQALQKLIKSYDPGLSENNKEYLSRLFAHLLQYVNDLFTNLNCNNIVQAFQTFDKLAPFFHDLATTNKVSTKKFMVELLKEKHDKFMKRPKLIPDLDTLIFFKLVSLLYPTSDFQHPVTTPSLTFMSEILFLSRFDGTCSISRGLFLTTLILEYTVLSKRLVPAAINFLRGILYLSANTSVLTPIQVVPPFKLHRDAKLLCLEDDCSKMAVNLKMAAKDLVTEEIDDDFKIRCLYTTVALLKEYFDHFSDMEAQTCIFEPHISLIGRVELDWYPKKVASKVREIVKYMKETLEVKTFKPLCPEKARPKALRMYEPDVQEVFTGSKSSKLSRENAERARLQTKYKKEMKGALREIRRDKAYIASVKIKQKLHSDNIRKEKVKQIYKDASIQQGELNKMKRMK